MSITFPLAHLSLPFLIDTGVTYLAISSEISCFPFGVDQYRLLVSWDELLLFFFSTVIPLQVSLLTKEPAFLLYPDSPVNLLGRDRLCSLMTTIFCSLDGVSVELLRVKALSWLLCAFFLLN